MKNYLFPIVGILITLSTYAQNVGINTTPASPPTNTLDVNGTLRVRGGTPGAGKVLTSDANGVGSWTTSSANYPPTISYDAILALPSPVIGQQAYDISFNCLRVYTGSKWICTYQNPNNYTANMIAIASAGGTGNDLGNSIAVDGSGNVYVTGFYSGTATFGATSITSAGISDIFVAKYNSIGTLQWVQSAGGIGNDFGNSIAVDVSGNVYVTGYYNGTATFGAITLTSAGSNDIFVAKYNSTGTLQWVQSAGGTSYDNSFSIAVDGSGNVYVTGYYNGTATFEAITITSAVGSDDIFVAKYNSSGTLQWVQSAGGTSGDLGYGIAVDGSGNVYVTGYYFGTATFGATPITSVGMADIFVAKYNSSGTLQWVKSAGGIASDLGNGIAIDGSGNVYFTGYYQGTATFGAGATSKTSAGGYEIFVAKYNSSGTLQWVYSAGGTSDDIGKSIAVDGSGNVYVTGYYYGSATFGANLITSVGSSTDIFVAKYNSSGTLQWVQSAGGISGDYGNSIAVDISGNIYVTGYYNGTATFGATSITSAGSVDIFVARLDK